MPLTLYVDGPLWRDHLKATGAASPGLVPVVKGNGYGFGMASLARRAEWMGCDTLAVGTYREVGEVAKRFSGDIVVLEPWRPYIDASSSSRVIHTLGRDCDLRDLVARVERPRVVLEGLTSMRRHGFDVEQLASAQRSARGVRIEGHALHLPLGGGHLREAERWLADAPAARWFVSHLEVDELAQLQQRHPGLVLRPRVGTGLWLGERQALAPRATVQDVHPVRRGERVGYRQRAATRDGHILVVAGGTAHGIGLEAPPAAASTRSRAGSVARGGLLAVGRALSPFTVAGRQRWFVEPPHMQVSLVFVPGGTRPPAIGDELEVQVRYTTTTFDEVRIS